jgi:hypothetical protein
MRLASGVRRQVQLRYEAMRQDAGLPPLGQEMVTAGLVALDGQCAQARAMLRDAIGRHDAWPPRTEHGLVSLAHTAIVCDDLALAGELLGSFHAGDGSVCVAVGHSGRGGKAGVVGCRIAPGVVAFELKSALFESQGFLSLVSRWLFAVPMVVGAARRTGVGAERIRLDLADGANGPGLGFCARAPDVTLIPDPDFLRLRGYQSLRDHLAANPVPWAARRPVGLWRGSTNGRKGKGDWRTLPRVTLCRFMQGPDSALFDVGITNVGLPAGDPGHEGLAASGLMRPPVDVRHFQDFRYQIDIDGFTNAWSGLFQKLLTGSAVLKVASSDGWRQWYYDRLVPWTNFVPVESDLGDLVEKLRWLIAHDEAAARIGQAGRELAESLTYATQVEEGAAAIARAVSA